MSRPLLFGPNGKPVSYGLYPSPRHAGTRHYRPRPYAVVQDTKKNVTSFDWWEGLNYSRQLFAGMANLGGAIVQKNLWAFGDGWVPQYTGQNAAWGQQAEEWLREIWMPTCNVRGEPYDFKTSLFLDGIAQDVDGDQLCVFTKTETGFPQLQFVPAHLICSVGDVENNKVKGGKYDGATIYNGILFNRKNRMIAVRVKEEQSEENPDGYRDIPAFNCQLLYEPEWSDQGRGIPRVARALLDLFDTQDIDFFLKRIVKQDASMGILRKVKGGEAVAGEDHLREEEDSAESAAPKKLDIEEIRGGEFWYLDAAEGEDITPYSSQRPHPNVEAFVERIEHRSLFSIGWSRYLLDPSKLGGANVRMIIDLAQMSIRQRQSTARKRAKRAIVFAIATAMEIGRLPKNYDDFWKWEYDMPKEITADTGNEEAAERDNLKMGGTTLAAFCQRHGKNWQENRTQKQKEGFDLLDRVAAVQKYAKEEHGITLSYAEAKVLIEDNTNGNMPVAPKEKKNETTPPAQDS